MTTHTAGPWERESDGEVGARTHYIVADQGLVRICSLERCVGVSAARFNANARLIAASPAMHAALRLYFTDREQFERAARAALATVEGDGELCGSAKTRGLDAQSLIQAIRSAGHRPRAYSGRGMFGAHCVSVHLDSAQRLMELGPALAARFGAIPNATLDQLGRGVVAYWPLASIDEGHRLLTDDR